MKFIKSEIGDRKGESAINAAEKEAIRMKEMLSTRVTPTKYAMSGSSEAVVLKYEGKYKWHASGILIYLHTQEKVQIV